MARRTQMGFTLIELMLAVAIIGVIAMIALPSYRNFTIRTKVSELVLAAGAFRTPVAEKAQLDGELTNAGVGLTVVPSGKVSGGSVTDDGLITIAGNAATVGTAVTIVMIPSLTSDGKVVWTCGTSSDSFDYVPNECRNIDKGKGWGKK